MVSGAGLAAALVMVATLYWVNWGNILGRVTAMLTMDRALTVGGFTGGLMFGPAVMKLVVGFVGGFGALAIGGAIDIGAMQFALAVIAIIAVLSVTGGEED